MKRLTTIEQDELKKCKDYICYLINCINKLELKNDTPSFMFIQSYEKIIEKSYGTMLKKFSVSQLGQKEATKYKLKGYLFDPDNDIFPAMLEDIKAKIKKQKKAPILVSNDRELLEKVNSILGSLSEFEKKRNETGLAPKSFNDIIDFLNKLKLTYWNSLNPLSLDWNKDYKFTKND